MAEPDYEHVPQTATPLRTSGFSGLAPPLDSLARQRSSGQVSGAGPSASRMSTFEAAFLSTSSSAESLPSPATRYPLWRESVSSFKTQYGLLENPILQSNSQALDKEADDGFHDPTTLISGKAGPSRYLRETSGGRRAVSFVGLVNTAGVVLICLAIVGVFAGYPIGHWALSDAPRYNVSVGYYDDKTTPAVDKGPVAGLPVGGAAYSYAPNITTRTGPIDPDTPESAYTKLSADGKTTLHLVFSDEFNEDGRIFDPGMDPFWEAVDLWYWQTVDLEWYDPGNAGTQDGYLWLELSKESMAVSRDLGYFGGAWNKFCFSGGMIDASISLPGSDTSQGYWPGFWMMGNLGRAGYGGSLDGMWPYSYDFCDVGTLPNQTDPVTGEPKAALTHGDGKHDDNLSWLAGQKLSRCTCPGDDHPGPIDPDGEFPEYDVFEALVYLGFANISQSAQVAPFNLDYQLSDTSAVTLYNSEFGTRRNTFVGSATQQSASGISLTDTSTYNQTDTSKFAQYGLEYTPTLWEGYGTGEMTWMQQDQRMWTLNDRAFAADAGAMISNRTISAEPLYIIANLGMSNGFTEIELDTLTFPARMRIDYIRVYQQEDKINIGCSPDDYPTADYIASHLGAYHNANFTDWASAGYTKPRNRLVETC
ncbi:hypothetical protein JCM10207_001499 [Rhodosporidiobolus poonsookiae]